MIRLANIFRQKKACRELAKHVSANRQPVSDTVRRSVAARRGYINSRNKRALAAYHKFCNDPVVKTVSEPNKRPPQDQVALLRSAVYLRDGGGCYHCGKYLQLEQIKLPNYATLEHLTPVMFGGTNELSNLVLACSPCNNKMGVAGSRIPALVVHTKKALQRQIPRDLLARLSNG